MTVSNLVVLIVVVLAVAGMSLWIMCIEDRQGDASGDGDSQGPGGRSSENEERIRNLEEEVDSLALQVKSHSNVLGEVQGGLEDLREAQERLDSRVDVADVRGVGEEGPAVALPRNDDLRAAVEAVLAAKEEEQAQERRAMIASRTSTYLLYGIEVTPAQREEITRVVMTYLDERAQARNDSSDDAARKAAQEELDRRRNEDLVRIVGASAFAKMEERLNRVRGGNRGMPRDRRGGGRRDGGRGGDRGR